MASIGALISIIATLLPELIALAKSLKDSPQETRLKRLAEVKAALVEAKTKLGNTKPIEDVIND